MNNAKTTPTDVDNIFEFDYSDEWLCAVGKSLEIGMEVYINLRQTPLEVTDIETTEGSGPEHPYTVVYLKGNGTEYDLKIPNEPNTPTMDWPSNEGLQWVKRIEPADGGATALVADQSAAEFIEPAVAEQDTLSDALDGLGEETDADGDCLGECPDCGGSVVADDGQATCTGCPLWCPRDEWDAYYGSADG